MQYIGFLFPISCLILWTSLIVYLEKRSIKKELAKMKLEEEGPIT